MQLQDVVAILDAAYQPQWADDWDSVGTIVGDPDAEIHKVLLALDPVPDVVAEAIAWGADLIVTHHPLFLTPVSSVAANTVKGRMVHDLITHGIALHNVHTNADVADRGVSEALANVIGLTDVTVLSPAMGEKFDKWIVFVPRADADRLADAMHTAGAGQIGDYDHVSFRTEGEGRFRPLDGANPHIGSVGTDEKVDEYRLEIIAPRTLRTVLYDIVMNVHPYEEPAVDIVELGVLEAKRGHGRVGRLDQAMTLREFAHHVATVLPQHHGGTRVHGDLDSSITTVAVIGGSGGSMVDQITADVVVTSDLKHHQVLENFGRVAIVDVPHWASESVWLPVVKEILPAELDIKISDVVTDPWSLTING